MNTFKVNSNITGLKISNLDLVIKSNFYPKNKLALIEDREDGTSYQCIVCSAIFLEKEKLELHLVMHNKEYRFICGICGIGLKRKEHLERHTLGHQEVRPHVCQECGKGFKRKEHLNIHKSIHSGDKSQICPLCSRSFYRKDHLMKHLQTHNKLFEEQNMVTLTDEETMELKQEIQDVKPIIDEDYDMSVELEDVDSLLPEVQVTTPGIPTVERPFACHLCEKTYKRKDHLKMHSYSHLEKDKLCPECGKGFHKSDQLLLHMNSHVQGAVDSPPSPGLNLHDGVDIPEDEYLKPYAYKDYHDAGVRPHACSVCHRRFKRKQHLKVHMNVHARIQQPTIWCSLCSEGFHTNSEFERHECVCEARAGADVTPANHKKENQPDYPPEFIDLSEAENSSYYSQQSSVPEDQLPTPQRVYVCKFCNKPFKRKDHYKIHLHIHTGVKNFFCTDCGKGFYRKDHLQKHGLVHIKNKLIPPKVKKQVPALMPINLMPRKPAAPVTKSVSNGIRPEITITAPSNMKLRVPLQIKVPYQVVTSSDRGEQQSVTIDPADTA